MSRKQSPPESATQPPADPQTPPARPRRKRTVKLRRPADFGSAVQQYMSEEDMRAICAALTEAARSGSVVAAKLLFDYMGGPPKEPLAPAGDPDAIVFYIPVRDPEPTEDGRRKTEVAAL